MHFFIMLLQGTALGALRIAYITHIFCVYQMCVLKSEMFVPTFFRLIFFFALWTLMLGNNEKKKRKEKTVILCQ